MKNPRSNVFALFANQGVVRLAPLTLLFAIAALVLPSVAALAWNPDAPASLAIYTAQQKAEQASAASAAITALNEAVKSGRPGYTFSAQGPTKGVYRFSGYRPISLTGCHNFTISAAGCTFIGDNLTGELMFANDCSRIALAGPLTVESDPPAFSQVKVIASDPATSTAQVQIMPGYAPPKSTGATLLAYGPDGVWLSPSPKKQWPFHHYKSYAPKDPNDPAGRNGVLSVDPEQMFLMTPGNYLALGGAPVLLWAPRVDGLTLKDVTLYTGGVAEIASGGGTGDWNFIRVKAIPEPGTSRLVGGSGPQLYLNRGGNMTFDSCAFQGSTDDDLNAGSSNSAMVYKQDSPVSATLYGGKYQAGDLLAFYAVGTYADRGKARVVSVMPITDAALIADAKAVQKTQVQYRAWDGVPMFRVTLDRSVSLSQADLLENLSGRGNRFTMKNCTWTDGTVRVMAQGFQTGLFTGNTFTRIVQGLAVTEDAWWWEGARWDRCVIKDNVFDQTPYGTYWPAAAIHYGISTKATSTTLFGPVVIEGNRIANGMGDGISVNNAAGCTLRGNTIRAMTGVPVKQSYIGSPPGKTIADSAK